MLESIGIGEIVWFLVKVIVAIILLCMLIPLGIVALPIIVLVIAGFLLYTFTNNDAQSSQTNQVSQRTLCINNAQEARRKVVSKAIDEGRYNQQFSSNLELIYDTAITKCRLNYPD